MTEGSPHRRFLVRRKGGYRLGEDFVPTHALEEFAAQSRDVVVALSFTYAKSAQEVRELEGEEDEQERWFQDTQHTTTRETLLKVAGHYRQAMSFLTTEQQDRVGTPEVDAYFARRAEDLHGDDPQLRDEYLQRLKLVRLGWERA